MQISMSEMFDKSQMSESFDVPAGCSVTKFVTADLTLRVKIGILF